jgi:hypothetical protein
LVLLLDYLELLCMIHKYISIYTPRLEPVHTFIISSIIPSPHERKLVYALVLVVPLV